MKPKEFWSTEITAASWKKLTLLSKEFAFILIGGWAAYLWTRAHKSKDIDLAVDYATLENLKQRYPLQKNERLKKYEIKTGEFDIDVYVAHYSRLAVPAEELKNYTTQIDGITTVTPEMLVVLKQGAELDRRGSLKGRKDRIDITTLLLYSPFDRAKYRALLTKFGLGRYEHALKQAIQLLDPKDSEYVGLDFKKFGDWRKKFLKGF